VALDCLPPGGGGGRGPGTGNPLWCGPLVPGRLDFFMGNPTFIRASLSDVRVIMTTMHVLIKLICQATIG
jgi:hypothetical protein